MTSTDESLAEMGRLLDKMQFQLDILKKKLEGYKHG